VKPSHQFAVIVVSYNTRDLLLECLSSVIGSTDYAQVEIVVVDNSSRDQSAEAVCQAYPEVNIIRNESNLGFGAACNQGIRATGAPFILLLNSDARLTGESFHALCDAVNLNDSCGAAGCRIVTPDGVETTNTRNFLTPFNQALELLGVVGRISSRFLKRTYRPTVDPNQIDCAVDWIDGACLMLRRSALDKVGLFDEQFFMYSEDEDLCLRLKKSGWTICYSASGSVVHHGAASSSQNEQEMLVEFYTSQMRLLAKHHGAFSALLYMTNMCAVLMIKRAGARILPGKKINNERLTKQHRALISAWTLRKHPARPSSNP
jgi:GT2 family glycosyltransferase